VIPHDEPALVVRAVAQDGKPRPSVVIGRRSGGWLLATLTGQEFCYGHPNEPYKGSEVKLVPGAYLDDGYISRFPLQVISDEDIDWRPIGRARRSLGERIIDVHGHELLSIGEIEEFLWACEEDKE
jgi:hypothetical protein